MESITHMGHETYRRVATWFFVGAVRWRDGTRSQSIDIAPYQLCTEGDAASEVLIRKLLAQLTAYLNEVGTWHDQKHTRDGRVYTWTPYMPEGRREVQP